MEERACLAQCSRGISVHQDWERQQQAVGVPAEDGSWEIMSSTRYIKWWEGWSRRRLWAPVMSILHQGCSSIPDSNNGIKWGPSVQICEPMGDISHSSYHILLLTIYGSWPYSSTKCIYLNFNNCHTPTESQHYQKFKRLTCLHSRQVLTCYPLGNAK